MTLHKLRLSLYLNATTREYDIYPIQSSSGSQTKEAFSIAPPGLSASQNILLGISGQQNDVTIDFTIWDDGTDRSNGTAPTSAVVGKDHNGNDITYTFGGTVVTVEEQTLYLNHVMQAADFSAQWELDQLSGSKFNGNEVFVETIEPDYFSVDSPKWKPCRMALRFGRSVG